MKKSVSVFLSLIAFMTVGCADSKSSEAATLVPTIYFKPTIYATANKCTRSTMKDILSLDGSVLEQLCEADYKQCLMQGSCFVDKNGKVTSYQYHSTKEGIPRFAIGDMDRCPYGMGVRNICLDPYFSVAADPEFYNYGDVLFIPRLVGALLPNLEIHDGYVMVRDVGGAIVGANRFDFYTGFIDHTAPENTFARLGFSDPKNKFAFRRATAEEALAMRERRGFPGVK